MGWLWCHVTITRRGQLPCVYEFVGAACLLRLACHDSHVGLHRAGGDVTRSAVNLLLGLGQAEACSFVRWFRAGDTAKLTHM